MDYRIYSYNVNGIRAAIKKGFFDWLVSEKPNMLSIQELKANEDQVNLEVLKELGYHYFWYPAEKKGYSGVALFSRTKPDFVQFGMDFPDYDSEGRLIRADFGNLTLISVYFPSGTTGEIRQAFKMKFLNDFFVFIQNLRNTRPNIIISGDINIAHKEIDINHPKRHLTSSGFLPEERMWMDKFLAAGFVDTFRVINSMPEQYSWWTYRANAREKNLGWRIDYHFVTNTLLDKIMDAQIHKDIIHSDHCPVSFVLKI